MCRYYNSITINKTTKIGMFYFNHHYNERGGADYLIYSNERGRG